MKNIIELINESSSNRRNILIKYLTVFCKDIYNDDDKLIIGDNEVAEIWDDGTIVFPDDFPVELAKFIVRCWIYSHSDWETDESDYFISLGDPNKNGKEIKW